MSGVMRRSCTQTALRYQLVITATAMGDTTPIDENTRKAWGQSLATELTDLTGVAFCFSVGIDFDPENLMLTLKHWRSQVHGSSQQLVSLKLDEPATEKINRR